MIFRECPEHGPISEKLIQSLLFDEETRDECPIINTSWGESCDKPLGPPVEMVVVENRN